jgi:parallel beta-helix repeat protein
VIIGSGVVGSSTGKGFAAAGHGMVLYQGANDVTLAGNEVHDNRRSGIDVNSSLRLRLSDNVVYGNDIGLHVHGRSRSVVADANRLSANRLDGVHLAGLRVEGHPRPTG